MPLPKICTSGFACCGCFSLNPRFTCSRCQKARFCSAECQKSSWASHKKTCKEFSHVNAIEEKLNSNTYSNVMEWFRDSQLKIYAYANKKNGGYTYTKEEILNVDNNELNRFFEESKENRILDVDHFIFYSPKCSVCFKSNSKAGKKIILGNCKLCSWGFFCEGTECEKKHKHSLDVCEQYSLMNEVETYQSRLVKEGRRFNFTHFMPIHTETQIQSYSNWDNYFKERKYNDSQSSLERVLLTDKLTQVLTTYKALRLFYPKNLLQKMKKLVIHVVGAAEPDGLPEGYWEELLHLLPNLMELKVVMIGPDLEGLFEESLFNQDLVLDCCPNCKEKNRKRCYGFSSDLYHDFVDHSSYYSRPDLIVAFNSGIHEAEQDTWLPTILKFHDEKYNMCFTSFNKNEANKDARLLKAFQFELLQEPEENKFKSLIPTSEMSMIDQFYHFNNYTLFCKASDDPLDL